jgi:hypothetical protein
MSNFQFGDFVKSIQNGIVGSHFEMRINFAIGFHFLLVKYVATKMFLKRTQNKELLCH